MQRAIEKAVETINGQIGDPRSFDRLDELLNAQSYRLAFWRVAAEEINYRRFFDVNDLAAIRVELPEVFDAAHRLLFELVASGAVTGLRIDHPDGLYRPQEYFEKLQIALRQGLARSIAKGWARDLSGRRENSHRRRNVAAKLASPRHHRLRVSLIKWRGCWSITTREGAITKIFKRFIGHSMHFGHLVYAKKRLVMRISLANEVNVLGNMVDRLSEQNRWFRDFTLEALARAVRETIACFPVYRTYLEPGEPVSEEDRAVIERAVAAAKRRNPAIEESVFNFLRDHFALSFSGKPGRRSNAPRTRISFSSSSNSPDRSWRRDWRTRSFISTTVWRR